MKTPPLNKMKTLVPESKTQLRAIALLECVILATLNTMERDEIRTLAKRIGVKVGKSRASTVINLLDAAMNTGQMHAKIRVEFCPKPENPNDYRVPVFGKKFSNGKPPKVFRTIV